MRQIASPLDSLNYLTAPQMTEPLPTEDVARAILAGGVVDIRNVEGGEDAYWYSSGAFGPGYVTIKGTVGIQTLQKLLVRQLALKIAHRTDFDLIAGLVTGGVTPMFLLRDYLQELQGREIHYVYIRDTRKSGGSAEQVTGLELLKGQRNPLIPEGLRGVVGEELVNFANSLTNGAGVLRSCGLVCDLGLTILEYRQPNALAALQETHMGIGSLLTLHDLLDVAADCGAFEPHLVDDWRWFLRNPQEWMDNYGYKKEEHTR